HSGFSLPRAQCVVTGIVPARLQSAFHTSLATTAICFAPQLPSERTGCGLSQDAAARDCAAICASRRSVPLPEMSYLYRSCPRALRINDAILWLMAPPLPAGITTTNSGSAVAKSRRPLDAFFRPNAVAVIGASETPGSVGRTLLWNLISNSFGGTV